MVTLVYTANRRAHQSCRLGHCFHCPEILFITGCLQNLSHRLCNGQIPGAHEHQNPIVGALEDRHLAIGRDLVHARVGARVGEKDQALIETGCDAVSHDREPIKSNEMVPKDSQTHGLSGEQ